ncbi:DNA (cytosine-5-)-methyltransferase [soil metagenome]
MKRECEISSELPGFKIENKWGIQQELLLRKCVEKGLELDDLLDQIGKTRNDLRYLLNSKSAPVDAYAPKLDDFKKPHHGVPLISLFSGCGGMDLGLEAAGFHHMALVEHNQLFCETLRHNRPKWRVIGPPTQSGDVSNREELFKVLTAACELKVPFDGLLVGGPPCQPFSIAANQRFRKGGDKFKRVGFEHEKNGNLLFDMLWFISVIKPIAFLIENVEGLYDVDGGEQLQRALNSLSKWGYTVEEPFVLDAAHFFVPQHRRRIFICGSRLGHALKRPIPSFESIPSEAAIRRSMKGVKNHEPRCHKAESLLRYMTLNYGQRDKLGRVDRLDPCLPSKTVIAGGTSGGGRSHLHPSIPRTMTVRESARLQTFPDDYVFLGPSARQFTQVGNAVPPVLAAQLGAAIYSSYFGNKNGEIH